jgi:lysophospholipid acyltransferase (LPLAT)-like uncharacterized protein
MEIKYVQKTAQISNDKICQQNYILDTNCYCATLRFSIINDEPWQKYIDEGGRVLLCAWHQQFFPAIPSGKKYRKYRPTLMASKSLDGEIAAGVARQMGWNPVRGSSSRDGGFALKEMADRLKKYGLALLLLDAPRGPAGIVKPGAIKLAQATDAIIVPAYVRAERAWYFRSWDKFMIPKPFSRVTLNYCNMIKLPPIETDADFENQRLMLEKLLRPYLQGYSNTP